MIKSHDYDHLIKILIVGDTCTGKSCILTRYVNESFIESQLATIGVDFSIKTIELENKTIKLQIWDTAGQEKFRTIVTSYYRGSNAVILTYSITSKESFDNIIDWNNDCSKYAPNNICKILVATKTDLEKNRIVTKKEGHELAKQLGVEFVEISSKANANVDLVFEMLAKNVLKSYKQIKKIQSVSITNDNYKKKSDCC